MQPDKAVGTIRVWEIVVAAMFLAVGTLVVWESRRLGSQWGSDGPQAGYFPFYIGLLICIASVVNLYTAIARADRGAFVQWGQLRMILIVMIPCVIYVALIVNPWFTLGIYLASALFIAFFMRYLGKYGWAKIAGVSIGTVFAFFLMFEIWFKVPLPKGFLETAFGFN